MDKSGAGLVGGVRGCVGLQAILRWFGLGNRSRRECERTERMAENGSLLGSGAGMVAHNKRYILWFYVLNLLLGGFGTVAFFAQSGTILGPSMYSSRLVHGFALPVLIEMFARPEFGPTAPSALSAVYFSAVFFLLTALFLPGVFQGYGSNYRLLGE